MDLFNKVHIFEPMESHIYEPNISLISLISLMFNYAKPRMYLILYNSKKMKFANFRKLCDIIREKIQLSSVLKYSLLNINFIKIVLKCKLYKINLSSVE